MMRVRNLNLFSVGLALILVSGICRAQLPVAQFNCHVSGGGDDITPTDCPGNVPFGVEASYAPVSTAKYPPRFELQASSTGGSSGTMSGPKSEVNGFSKNNVSPGASASFGYSLQLTPFEEFVSALTGLSFEVKSSGQGRCTAIAGGPHDSAPSGYCETTLTLFPPDGNATHYAAYDCAADGIVECPEETWDRNFTYSHSFDLKALDRVHIGGHTEIRLKGASGQEEGSFAWARGMVDPNFWIDPEATVMIDGTQYLVTEVVELTFSEGIEYSGAPPEPFVINAGLNDVWVTPDAAFQGLTITVFPDMNLVFLAWFTFDSELQDGDATATLGAPDHRWITAIGTYNGNRVELEAELTTGGMFNTSEPLAEQDTTYGTIVLEFFNCEAGELTFLFPIANKTGSFPIQRLLGSNVPLCEALNSG
jgi:hypothetical protein